MKFSTIVKVKVASHVLDLLADPMMNFTRDLLHKSKMFSESKYGARCMWCCWVETNTEYSLK